MTEQSAAASKSGSEAQLIAVERLAEAVLAGRVSFHSESWEDRDGYQHTRTTVEVSDD